MSHLNHILRNTVFAYTFLGIVLVECISLIAHLYPAIQPFAYGLIVIGVLVASLWRLQLGFWIVVIELVVGSFGYLFYLDTEAFRISIRLGLFAVVFLAWIIHTMRYRIWKVRRAPFFWPAIAFAAMVLIGTIHGLVRGYPAADVFFDMNGYLYFGLLPVAITVIHSWPRVRTVLTVIVGSAVYSMVKTAALLFYFAHQTKPELIRIIYTWVRDTRVGEISPIVDTYYRIFFQSHIWVLFVFVAVGVILISYGRKRFQEKEYAAWWLIMLGGSITLIISFSRSIWLGLAITGLAALGYMLRAHVIRWRDVLRISGLGLLMLVVSLGIISGIVNVSLPGGGSGSVSTATLVSQRISETDEPAVGSRFQLLPPLVDQAYQRPFIGSGFGTTVTYQSLDPRTKEINGGAYTTYSFEWGYLDIITEIGILGLLVYAYFIWSIIRTGMRVARKGVSYEVFWFIQAVHICILSLLVIHFTTPYLNHPLGIGLLIIAGAIFIAIGREKMYTKNSRMLT